MQRSRLVLLVASLVFCVTFFGSNAEQIPLVFLNDSMALCLDGSHPGYYVRRTREPLHFAQKWMIELGGGAWCWSPENCYARSSTTYGSSTSWPRNISRHDFGGGVVSENCTVNPTFCNYNVIAINYCDGDSFSGMRTEPLVYNNTNLYLRGKYILNALLKAALVEGAITATHVVLTGGSAGGLAVFLHSDYVGAVLRSQIPTLVSFVAVPVSGFFLDQPNIRFAPMFESHLKGAFEIHNATAGVSSACIAAMPAGEEWRCNFAEYTYPYTVTPTFVLNSKTDFWQLTCILNVMPLISYPSASFLDIINGNCSSVPGYLCLNWDGYSNCSGSEMQPVVAYQGSFLERVYALSPFRDPRNGAFITSCFTHCEAMDDESYLEIVVGGKNMSVAVNAWYNDVTSGAPLPESGSHVHVDCAWTTQEPYRCNPTCPA